MIDKNLNFHRSFSINKKGTDYFVGDIHGEYYLLMDELKKVNFDGDKGDRLFSLGDIINKGPDSEKCAFLLLKPWFFAVKGNHEAMLLALTEHPEIIHSLRDVGGGWIDDLLHRLDKLTFIINLVYARTFFCFTVKTKKGSIGLVHANAPDDWESLAQRKISAKEETDCLWTPINYVSSENKTIKNIDIVVHGHVNAKNVVTKGNMIWIDTLKQTSRLTVLSAEQLFKEVLDV